ncbi:MAG TPA: SDR family oxidoreductase [Methylomirabilota bacterium]|jgi:3-oxoacyl-[acyl-carrier protein] reductase|nr:SDR family oxidoreductase [Methylomirabilota bacterium]
MLLANKVALITGSVRGTGAGIARVFAQAGAAIVLNQVENEGDPRRVLADIQALGGRAICINADITDELQVCDLVQQAEAAFGKVDILVSNYAASIPRKSFVDTTWADWQAQLDATLKAAVLCAQAVLPGMKARRWGRIISINTIGIHQPAPHYHGYTAAKTAMLGFTRTLAVEVGPFNITVNIVSPGLTLTEEVKAILTPELQAKHEQQVPLRRTGTVEDTANAALFFASELGSFVTGHYLPVCGGQVLE